MSSARERVEPGEEVTLVGYVGVSGRLDEPYLARLYGPVSANERGADRGIVGLLTIEATGLGGYLSSRVSITFEVPFDLEPGLYFVSVEGANGGYLGDLIGGYISVGVSFTGPLHVEWALDEPLIAELPDDALIGGPGFEVTAADLRAGRYPAGAEAFLMDPRVLDMTGVATTTAPTPTPLRTPTPLTPELLPELQSPSAPPSTSPAEVEERPAVHVSPAPVYEVGEVIPTDGSLDLWWLPVVLLIVTLMVGHRRMGKGRQEHRETSSLEGLSEEEGVSPRDKALVRN